MNLPPAPQNRIRTVADLPVQSDGRYVLYWMTAFRRCRSNFALQHACHTAHTLKKPLLVFEALRCDYPWASARTHHFILEGMRDNAATLSEKRIAYYPYVEPAPNAGKGLLAALAENACVVIGDDSPAFFLPQALAAASRKLHTRLEVVDSNGLLPLRTATKDYPSAYAFRRLLQKQLPEFLDRFPLDEPPGDLPPSPLEISHDILERWPPCSPEQLARTRDWLHKLPLDHAISPTPTSGGSNAARRQLQAFIDKVLVDYAENRNQLHEHATSGLSPYLHFGHIGSHEIFTAIARAENWHPGKTGPDSRGRREGWWGMRRGAEAFLDQLVTWRELGYNYSTFRDDAPRFDSLPDWAQATLENHADDPRPHRYTPEQFDAASTHDPLWNAAQTQLRRDGSIYGYLRMLWGKKILEWSTSPQEALQTMIELNNRYALDGRDPNSYSGILWCLGRYDRPWPERAIFGKVRSMSSINTARKIDVKSYLERFTP